MTKNNRRISLEFLSSRNFSFYRFCLDEKYPGSIIWIPDKFYSIKIFRNDMFDNRITKPEAEKSVSGFLVAQQFFY